jgi:Ferritin-like domain
MPNAESTVAATRRLGRDALLRRALTVAAAAGAGAAGVRSLERAAAAGGASSDADVLNFLLSLEELQRGYYDFAVAGGTLAGDALQFARTAAAHEREHVGALRRLLGGDARPAPSLTFGVPPDPPAFVRTAAQLEELAIAAQNGEGALLSRTALALVLGLSSTDARHAAWVRDLARMDPAPRAVDPGRPAADIARAVQATGFVQ